MAETLRISVSGREAESFAASLASAAPAAGYSLSSGDFVRDSALVRAAAELGPAPAGSLAGDWTLCAPASAPVATFAIRPGGADGLSIEAADGAPAPLAAKLAAFAAAPREVSGGDVADWFGRVTAQEEAPGTGWGARMAIFLVFALPIAGFVWMCTRFKWL